MPELGTTKQQRLNSVDADFQTRYVAAEQAYGAGDFQTAQAITSELLAELEPLLEAAEERDAALAWQAFVALLAGHIQLYGLQQTDQARAFYNLVLSSHPPDTLQELAEQGLERLAEQTTTQTIQTAELETAQTSLIRDPFLSAPSGLTNTPDFQAQTTATPWLDTSPPEVTGIAPDLSSESVSPPLSLPAEGKHLEEKILEKGEHPDEAAILESATNKPELICSTPIPEGLLQKLKAGRLRVDL